MGTVPTENWRREILNKPKQAEEEEIKQINYNVIC